MSYNSEGDTSPMRPLIIEPTRQSIMEDYSLQQNEDKITQKFEYVQLGAQVTIKENVGVVDSELHIAYSNMKFNNVEFFFNKREIQQ